MENYIRRYDNVISPELCDTLIDRFENSPHQYEKQEQGKMSFTQIHLLHHNEWREDAKIIAESLMTRVVQYKKDCDIPDQPALNMFPEKFTLEPMRLKRYLPDGTDQFGDHVDVDGLKSAKRFLVMFLYLDDNKKGRTLFPRHDVVSECKKGSCLLFPPLWPWLHAGEKPVDKPKYIVGSYLHYV